jgi:hypothetical protein
LWPTVPVDFNPEKAFAFATALAAWLFVELFPESATNSDEQATALSAFSTHDSDLALALLQIVDGDFVRFLRQHDFGGPWRKGLVDPAYALEDFLGDPNSVFEDQTLANILERLVEANDKFVRKLSLYGGPIHGMDLFDMIPSMEKQSGIWSPRTYERIKEVNDLADQLAAVLVELFGELRKKGLSLAKRPPPPSFGWRPL